MTKSLIVTLILWAAEVFLIAVLVSDQWLTNMQDAEDRMIIEYLGADNDRRIRDEANAVFNALLVETGIQRNVYHFFILPLPSARNRSGLNISGRPIISPWSKANWTCYSGRFTNRCGVFSYCCPGGRF